MCSLSPDNLAYIVLYLTFLLVYCCLHLHMKFYESGNFLIFSIYDHWFCNIVLFTNLVHSHIKVNTGRYTCTKYIVVCTDAC